MRPPPKDYGRGAGIVSAPVRRSCARTRCQEQDTEEAIEVTPWFGSACVDNCAFRPA